jgi:beta-1,2-mannosidase
MTSAGGKHARFVVALSVALGALPAGLAQAQWQPWMLGPFEKPAVVNPIITPGSERTFLSPMNDSVVRWEGFATFNPAATVKDGKVYVLYRAEDATGRQAIGHHTSRIGLAESTDGLRFTRRAAPVLYPDKDAQAPYEWTGGVEDPRIVATDDGRYVLTYTQWNRDIPRLAIATSRDLVRWTKHGPAFAAADSGRYLRIESKSGAILSRVVGDRVVATKVNGKYWMYFSVPEHGIVVLYNAGNSGRYGEPGLAQRMYTGGQALFDARNPIKLLARSTEPFIKPTEAYERTGQYVEGTTFVEGLVPFNGRWFLYYGTADSRVGVAVWDPGTSARH